MAKVKTMYFCKNCGAESPKWIGRCPACGEWNTYVEEPVAPKGMGGEGGCGETAGVPILFCVRLTEEMPRF